MTRSHPTCFITCVKASRISISRLLFGGVIRSRKLEGEQRLGVFLELGFPEFEVRDDSLLSVYSSFIMLSIASPALLRILRGSRLNSNLGMAGWCLIMRCNTYLGF